MAEGGGDYAYDNTWFDRDEDYDDEQEANSTQPFQPGQVSTPYHGGEQVEMKTMHHEKSGAPSYEETSFGGEKTPLISKTDFEFEDLERQFNNLRKDIITGIYDTSKIPNAIENPLSLEDQNEQIESTKSFIRRRFPYVDFSKLVIRYSLKNPMEIVAVGPKAARRLSF